MIANMARDVAHSGLLSVLVYMESIDDAQAEINRIEAALVLDCDDFSLTFTDATPTPSPTPEPTFAPIPTPRLPAWAS